MTLESDAKFEEESTCQFKIDMRNLANFDPSTQKFPKFVFNNGWPLTKVYNVWAYKVQGSYVWWHWRLIQHLKENWLVLLKMTWEIWQIFTRALENLKFVTLMGSFDPKYKMYKLKIYSRVTCHDNKNDVKFEEESICQFKIDIRNLTNFDTSTQKSQKFALLWAAFNQSI